MRKQFLAVVAVCAVVLGLAGTLVWAAGAATVDIPFSFFIKDKEMPAGRYEISVEGSNMNRLVIRAKDGGQTSMVPVLTRLADTGAKEPMVVFDKANDKYYLSEVHLPGKDGFAVQGAPGKHTHETVSGKE
jgi:hypothetical protein